MRSGKLQYLSAGQRGWQTMQGGLSVKLHEGEGKGLSPSWMNVSDGKPKLIREIVCTNHKYALCTKALRLVELFKIGYLESSMNTSLISTCVQELINHSSFHIDLTFLSLFFYQKSSGHDIQRQSIYFSERKNRS